MHKKLPLLLVSGVLLSATFGQSQEVSRSKKQSGAAQNRTASKPAVLDFNAVSIERKRSVNELLQLVEVEAKKKERKFSETRKLEAGIRLLGEYRALQAVEFLVDHIDLKGTGATLELTPLVSYPVVGALVEIGNPARDRILEKLSPPMSDATEIPERKLHLYSYVIRRIDGDEVGLYRLQLAEKQATGTHKINLLNLIDIYKLNESAIQVGASLRRSVE